MHHFIINGGHVIKKKDKKNDLRSVGFPETMTAFEFRTFGEDVATAAVRVFRSGRMAEETVALSAQGCGTRKKNSEEAAKTLVTLKTRVKREAHVSANVAIIPLCW